MPGKDLEDFELEHTARASDEQTESGVILPRAPEPGGRLFPLTLAAIALVVIGALALLFLLFRHPATPKPAAPATGGLATPSPSVSEPPGPANAGPLPTLDASDDFVRHLAAGLSSRAELARWLAQTDLVRTLTAVVTNVADGESPRPHLAFLAPAQRFRAKGGPRRRIVADPASFAGYDRFADTVASIDAGSAVAAYRTLEPLFDAAYRELGHPEGGFRHAVDRAGAALLAAPVPPPDAELVPHAIGFRYADPRLEGLTAAQKQFLRMGPRNVPLVQAKIREVLAALGAEAAPAAPGR